MADKMRKKTLCSGAAEPGQPMALQYVLYFLEEIFPFFAVFVFQYKTSVLLYTQQPGKELAVGVFIRMQSPATEKGAGIPCGYLVGVGSEVLHLEAVVVDLYTSQDMGKDFITVVLLSGDLFQ